MKEAIERRLSAIPELAPMVGRARKRPRIAVVMARAPGNVRTYAGVELVLAGSDREEARRLMLKVRLALHGAAIPLAKGMATPRHVPTDYAREQEQTRALARFKLRIEDDGNPSKAREGRNDDDGKKAGGKGEGEAETPAKKSEGLHDT